MKYSLSIITFVVALIACDNRKPQTTEHVTKTNNNPSTETNPLMIRNDTFSVARTDETRVFVIIDSSLINDSKIVKDIIFTLRHYGFQKQRISFFSDYKYAGYKTEFIKDSLAIYKWATSYIGEYDTLTNELWTFPLNANKKLKYIIQ